MSKIKFVVVLVLAALPAGCDLDRDGNQKQILPDTKDSDKAAEKDNAEYLNKTAIRQETESQSESAVDTALQWAEKYAAVSEQLALIQRENRELREENQQLVKQVETLKGKLGRAENELSEANAMLMDLQKELGKWKQNVLGYRKEMRQASQAEMEALIKILKLLGGEVPKAVSTPTTMPASVDSSGEKHNENT